MAVAVGVGVPEELHAASITARASTKIPRATVNRLPRDTLFDILIPSLIVLGFQYTATGTATKAHARRHLMSMPEKNMRLHFTMSIPHEVRR